MTNGRCVIMRGTEPGITEGRKSNGVNGREALNPRSISHIHQDIQHGKRRKYGVHFNPKAKSFTVLRTQLYKLVEYHRKRPDFDSLWDSGPCCPETS